MTRIEPVTFSKKTKNIVDLHVTHWLVTSLFRVHDLKNSWGMRPSIEMGSWRKSRAGSDCLPYEDQAGLK
jgi:hypothetical protein